MSQENKQGQVTDLEESLFDANSVDSIFEPAPTSDTPEQPTVEPVAEGSAVTDEQVKYATPESNEEVRYQYWQSEADKAKNENEQLKKTIDILQNTMGAQSQDEVQPAEVEPEPEPFRSAPEKPTKPHNFNRAEAIDDPASESARYLDSLDAYRDEMDTYNSERVEYESQKLQEEREAIAEKQRQQQEAYEAEQRQMEQMTSVAEQIRTQYNANEEEIVEFIEQMSSPDSISVDNLWKLYQMDKGKVPASPVQQPSPEFSQVKRAQSVPQPMGVQSSANLSQTGKSADDLIMDDLIRDYENKNPW